ncbi:MAG TPA: outer membrane protein transport protein [Gammaproteobacteria bacterium]
MKNNKLKLATALGCILGVAMPASVFATNGMFLIGTGTKSRAMGGVGITTSHDVFSTAANPATMTEIEGNRFDIGGDIFTATTYATMGEGVYSRREESVPDHMTIADGIYIMPALGATWNKGDLSYGFTMVPVGGGGSRYDFNLFNCANDSDPLLAKCNKKMGVSLMVMNINPTIAMKLDEHHSVGATLIIGLQAFKAYGLGEFTQFTVTQNDTAKLTDNGTDIAYGAGIRLGWLGQYMEGKLRLGAEYTSDTYMSKFEEYSDLFAEQGLMNTPGNIGLGISYQFTDEFTAALDINYIMYENVNAVSNIGPDPRGDVFPIDRETNALGADEGLGFGWDNQTVYKLGLSYQYNQKWTLRGGWNYAKSPVDEEYDILFSTVAPAITQNHITMGATMQYNTNTELSFSYVHAFKYEQYGPTYINYEGGYEMSQNSIGMSLGMKF